MTLALTGTVHDPGARLLPALRAQTAMLHSYAAVFLAVSPETATLVRSALSAASVTIVPGGSEIGAARRAAARAAYDAGHTSLLAIDFDRWLFWATTVPAELAALPVRLERHRPRWWYVCLGRTRRAFASHPEVQRRTEAVTNAALSHALGRRLDAVAGASWLSREGAALILPHSCEPTNATDVEWPALVGRVAPERVGQLRCAGLAFETAAYFRAEVAAAGSEAAWMRQTYDTPASWQARSQLSTDSIAALARVLADPAGARDG